MIAFLLVADSLDARRLAELVSRDLTLAFAPAAYASGSSMPWETPLNSILESMQGPGRQDHLGDHHHRDRPDARLRRHVRRLPPADPDRLRPVDRLRRVELLPVLLLLLRRSAGLMAAIVDAGCARLLRAGPSRADRPDPARRRAADRRDRQRHARGGDRASACGSGSPAR